MKKRILSDDTAQGGLSAVQFQSLAEAAAQSLRDAIIAGKLKPGERLVEPKLAAQLAIGQPTLREALKELEHQGFVRKIANKGTHVTKLSREDCRKIFQVRMVLEGIAIPQAAANIDAAALQTLEAAIREMDIGARKFERETFHKGDLIFHRTIWKLCGNEYLESVLEQVSFSLFAFVLLAQEQKDFLAAVKQHKEILEGLRSRDPRRARETFIRSTVKFWENHHQISFDPQPD
ncbi:MAG TPA: GntR family transcriptional regulator [Acidobacteriota bacterium]|jgi:DNA-binding GntR family transcriptional regulator